MPPVGLFSEEKAERHEPVLSVCHEPSCHAARGFRIFPEQELADGIVAPQRIREITNLPWLPYEPALKWRYVPDSSGNIAYRLVHRDHLILAAR
jgi:hypothetical protein